MKWTSISWQRRALKRAASAGVLLPACAASGQTYVDWAAPVDGLWHDADNWSPAVVPGLGSAPDYTRVTGPAGTPFFATLDGGDGQTVALNTLLIRADGGVRLRSGSLQANAIRVDRGRFEFEGGTLANSRLEESLGEFVITGDAGFHDLTLAGTLRGEFDPVVRHGPLPTFRRLSFDNSTLELGEMTAIFDAGAAGLTGTGEILFTDGPGYFDNRLYFSAATDTVQRPTIGENITVRTAADGGWIGRSTSIGTGLVWLTNYGSIVAEGPDKLGVSSSVNFDNQGLLAARNGGTLDAAIGLGKNAGTLEFANGGRIELEGPRYYLDRPVTVPVGSTLQLMGGWGNTGGITVDGGELLLVHEPHGSSTAGTITFTPNSGASVRLSSSVPLTRLADLDTAPDTILGANIYHTYDLAGGTLDLNDYVGTWDLGGFNFRNGTLTDSIPQADYLPGEGHSFTTRDIDLRMPLTLRGDYLTAYAGTVINAPIAVDGGGRLVLDEAASVGPDGSVTIMTGSALRLNGWSGSGPAGVTMSGGILELGGRTFGVAEADALALAGTPDARHVVTGGTLDLAGGTLAPEAAAVPWRLAGGTVTGGSIDATGANGPLRVLTHSWLDNTLVIGDVVVDATADPRALLRLRGGTTLRDIVVTSSEPTLPAQYYSARLAVDNREGEVLLDNVTFATNASIASYRGGLTRVVNGLKLQGDADVNLVGYFTDTTFFEGDQAVGGDGTLWLRGDDFGGSIRLSGELTTLPGVTVHVRDLASRFTSAVGDRGAITNRGNWRVDPERAPSGYPPPPQPPVLTVSVDNFRNDAPGRFEVAEFGTLLFESPLDNRGAFVIAAGGSAEFLGDVINNGIFELAEGTSTRFAGRLSGAGSFIDGGKVVAEGTFAPGNGPAIAPLGGDLTLGDAATLEVELFGTELGEFDRLEVTGALDFGGTLEVVAGADFGPLPGDAFEFATYATRLDTFAAVHDSLGLPGLAFEIVYGDSAAAILPTRLLAGDANFDGQVSLADFLILRGEFGQGGRLAADFDLDGQVSLADFLILRGNFGSSLSGLAPPLASPGDGAIMDGWRQSVPEPTSLATLGLGGLLLLRRRSRR